MLRRLGFAKVLELTLLHAPLWMYRILPLVVILSTLWMFLSLARSSEMVVTRAAGRSALMTLISPVVTVFLFGILAVAVGNPDYRWNQQEIRTHLGAIQRRWSIGIVDRLGRCVVAPGQ